jgi:hypothetical protein
MADQAKSANNQPYKGVFEGMDFPEYQYEEFPMYMKNKQGQSLLVEDQEAHDKALADGWERPKGIGPQVVITSEDLQAKDSRIAELEAALEEAKAALLAKPLDVPKTAAPSVPPTPTPKPSTPPAPASPK